MLTLSAPPFHSTNYHQHQQQQQHLQQQQQHQDQQDQNHMVEFTKHVQ